MMISRYRVNERGELESVPIPPEEIEEHMAWVVSVAPPEPSEGLHTGVYL